MEIADVVLVSKGFAFMFQDEAMRCKDINEDTNVLWKFSVALLSFNIFVVGVYFLMICIGLIMFIVQYRRVSNDNKKTRIANLIESKKKQNFFMRVKISRMPEAVVSNEDKKFEFECTVCGNAFQDDELLEKTECNQRGHFIHKECNVANKKMVLMLKQQCLESGYCFVKNKGNATNDKDESKEKISVQQIIESPAEKTREVLLEKQVVDHLNKGVEEKQGEVDFKKKYSEQKLFHKAVDKFKEQIVQKEIAKQKDDLNDLASKITACKHKFCVICEKKRLLEAKDDKKNKDEGPTEKKNEVAVDANSNEKNGVSNEQLVLLKDEHVIAEKEWWIRDMEQTRHQNYIDQRNVLKADLKIKSDMKALQLNTKVDEFETLLKSKKDDANLNKKP